MIRKNIGYNFSLLNCLRLVLWPVLEKVWCVDEKIVDSLTVGLSVT
jgi:hypothetical protein